METMHEFSQIIHLHLKWVFEISQVADQTNQQTKKPKQGEKLNINTSPNLNVHTSEWTTQEDIKFLSI